MEVINLPQDLSLNTEDKIQLFNYRNLEEIRKTKINLCKHTISFLRQGIKEVIGFSEVEKIDNQSFLVMKSGHCLMTEKMSSFHKAYESILLFFDNDIILDFIEKYQLSVAPEKAKKSFYVFKYDEYLQQFVKSLESLIRLPQETQNKILQSKFEEIMLYLTDEYGTSFLGAILQSIDNRTIKLTNIVEYNKFHKLTLEELAFLCNMSLSTFKREFFKVYQSSPMKWFLAQRMEHVAVLLKSQQKRPIDLYEEAGYENFSNFVQAFKKKFGLTPKQYQDQF